MSGFLANLRDTCLFRRGPEDMPYSPPLLVALLVACAAMQVGFNLDDGAKPAVVAGSIIGGLVAIGVVSLLLRGRGKPERFVQTTTSLAAVYLLFGLVNNLLTLLLPLRALRQGLTSHPAHLPPLSGGQTLVVFVVAALEIWQLCVWIGILRRALDMTVAGGVLVFLLLMFVNLVVMALIANVVGAA
ncbi:MAG TPA: hypothetical protein VFW60_08665 [Rhodanobacteraceae bacterium]|nr:hypothetical protein [Rhodanobacteraceae bacterium]